jgi:hypothetical protein
MHRAGRWEVPPVTEPAQVLPDFFVELHSFDIETVTNTRKAIVMRVMARLVPISIIFL